MKYRTRPARNGAEILQSRGPRILGIFPSWRTLAMGPATHMRRICARMNAEAAATSPSPH